MISISKTGGSLEDDSRPVKNLEMRSKEDLLNEAYMFNLEKSRSEEGEK